MSPKKATKKRTMTDEHKASIAEGRVQAAAVKGYLEALEANRPKRGRKRTPQSIQKRLDAIEAALPEADAMTRLSLLQEQEDLVAELAQKSEVVDISAAEDAFVAHAAAYGARKGISYGVWRKMGIEAAVLKRAGISRGRAA